MHFQIERQGNTDIAYAETLVALFSLPFYLGIEYGTDKITN